MQDGSRLDGGKKGRCVGLELRSILMEIHMLDIGRMGRDTAWESRHVRPLNLYTVVDGNLM